MKKFYRGCLLILSMLTMASFTAAPAEASTSVILVFGTSTCQAGVWSVGVRLTSERVGDQTVDVYNTHPAKPVLLARNIVLHFGVAVDPALTFTVRGHQRTVTVDVVPAGALASAHIGEWRGVRPTIC